MLARLALESGDSEGAKRALNELLESTSDSVMRQVARVRLAVIALKDGEPEKIRTLAKAEAGEGFTSHFQELLGDALARKRRPRRGATGLSGSFTGGYARFTGRTVDYGKTEHDPKG